MPGTRGAIMSDIFGVTLAAVLTVLTSVAASAAEPIALRDMGSFHVGGRLVEISRYLQERTGIFDDQQPVRTVSHRRRPRLLRCGPGEAKADARQPVSRRRLRQFRQAERAALDHQR